MAAEELKEFEVWEGVGADIDSSDEKRLAQAFEFKIIVVREEKKRDERRGE